MDDSCLAVFWVDDNVFVISCVAFVVAIAAFVLLLFCRSRVRHNVDLDVPEKSSFEEEPAQAGELPVSIDRAIVDSPEIALSTLAEAVGGLPAGKLKSLLESRLQDIEDEDSDSARVFAVVGLLDEIRILLPTASCEEQDALQRVQTDLERYLKAMGAERIDDDEWNPERQRAVEVVKDLPAGAAPAVAEKVASGLIFNGRVALKQTVVLRMGA